MEQARSAISEGRFAAFRREFYEQWRSTPELQRGASAAHQRHKDGVSRA
jgi:hypothetical protein